MSDTFEDVANAQPGTLLVIRGREGDVAGVIKEIDAAKRTVLFTSGMAHKFGKAEPAAPAPVAKEEVTS